MSDQNAMPPAPPGGEARGASGLIGGIFSKRDHDSIRVKFTDVDWATIVRAGGVTHSEVRLALCLVYRRCAHLHSSPRATYCNVKVDGDDVASHQRVGEARRFLTIFAAGGTALRHGERGQKRHKASDLRS